jgi:hypothetical protein
LKLAGKTLSGVAWFCIVFSLSIRCARSRTMAAGFSPASSPPPAGEIAPGLTGFQGGFHGGPMQ